MNPPRPSPKKRRKKKKPQQGQAGKTYEVLLPGATLSGALQQATNAQEVPVYVGPFHDGVFHGARGKEHEYDPSGRER